MGRPSPSIGRGRGRPSSWWRALSYRGFGPMARLAQVLTPYFAVYAYDRRGCGQSGDTGPTRSPARSRSLPRCRGVRHVITLDDIRRYARALPEVEEATHFRLPSFKVRGKASLPFNRATPTPCWRSTRPRRRRWPPPTRTCTRKYGATATAGSSWGFESIWPRSPASVSGSWSSTPGGTGRPSAWWPHTTKKAGEGLRNPALL